MNSFNAKEWFKTAPDWANYVAVNPDGDVRAYQYRPYASKGYDDEDTWVSKGMEQSLGEIPSWKDTCTSREDAEAQPDASNERQPD